MTFLFNLLVLAILVAALFVWVQLPWYAVLVIAVLFAVWMAFSRRGRQAASVTNVGISTLKQRLALPL